MGSLPPSGWQLPASLRRLSLWKNSVKGTLPADWQLPPTLAELDLASNLLTGSIPPELKLPRTLQWLSLENNALSGGLPRGLDLPPGSILSVYDNMLSGEGEEGCKQAATALFPALHGEALFWLTRVGHLSCAPPARLGSCSRFFHAQQRQAMIWLGA